MRLRAAETATLALAGGAVVLLSFADGGFFERTWPPATVAFAAAAALAVVLLPRRTLSPAEVVLVACLAAFAGWQALSAVWSLEPSDSLLDAQRGVVYAAAALAFVAVAGRARGAWLLGGVATGTALVAAYSLGRRALEEPREDPFQGLLLYEPIGYANALGVLAALGLVVLVGLVAGSRSRTSVAVGAPVVAALAATLALTSSRGSWLAVAIGGATLAIFRAASAAARAAWLAGVGAALAAVLVSPLVWSPATLERGLSHRPYYWWTAWQALPEQMPLGAGADTFDALWAERAPIPEPVRDAHSLYLEALVELGPLGLALVLAALLAPLVVAVRSRPGWLPATAAGAYVAFLFHAGVDWDWELPAVTVAGLACGAAVLAQGPSAAGTRFGSRSIAVSAGVASAAAIAALLLGG